MMSEPMNVPQCFKVLIWPSSNKQCQEQAFQTLASLCSHESENNCLTNIAEVLSAKLSQVMVMERKELGKWCTYVQIKEIRSELLTNPCEWSGVC